ncbi:histone-lysine N-methyltransferase SETMAR [Trichonephila clavipes]|nr:histone-lysine N-methyltransferase SETMAR [Trichonephila clavipes]
MEVNKEKIRYILQAKMQERQLNGVYGADIVTANYVQLWFRRFRSDIFDVKGAPRTVSPVVKNVDKIPEIIDVDRHVSRSSAQEIHHTTFSNHLREVGFKKKFDVLAPQQLTPKFMRDQISISEALVKRNEIDPFLKRMVTGDEKWFTYDFFGGKTIVVKAW